MGVYFLEGIRMCFVVIVLQFSNNCCVVLTWRASDTFTVFALSAFGARQFGLHNRRQ
jgi:hypothetical protein